MSKAQHILPYTIYPQGEGLSAEDVELLQQAKNATQTSYAPYSHFCVGAALRLVAVTKKMRRILLVLVQSELPCFMLMRNIQTWRLYVSP